MTKLSNLLTKIKNRYNNVHPEIISELETLCILSKERLGLTTEAVHRLNFAALNDHVHSFFSLKPQPSMQEKYKNLISQLFKNEISFSLFIRQSDWLKKKVLEVSEPESIPADEKQKLSSSSSSSSSSSNGIGFFLAIQEAVIESVLETTPGPQ